MPRMTLKERFEDKFTPVTESGCWIWTATSDKRYGSFYTGDPDQPKMERAHRVSYKLYKGNIPEGILVCHECDVTLCVNPDHLFLGTHTDNMRDMANKGRAVFRTKYEVGVLEDIIFNLTPKEASEKYGIDAGHASRVKRGKTKLACNILEIIN